MTVYKDLFQCLVQKDSPYKLNLADDYQYPIKGMGESFYKLYLGNSMMMKEVLYVLGLKKNILSISRKVSELIFVDGEVLMRPKKKI